MTASNRPSEHRSLQSCIYALEYEPHMPSSPERNITNASAMDTLANARTDRHSLLLAQGCQSRQPRSLTGSAEALNHVANRLSAAAQGFRRARLDEAPTPRLDVGFFPDATGPGVLGELTDILVFGFDGLPRTHRTSIGDDHRQRTEIDAGRLVTAAHRYPGIPPDVEKALAAQGFTCAELLTVMACEVLKGAVDICIEYGAPANARTTTEKAWETAQDTLEVIEAGVTHTLTQ